MTEEQRKKKKGILNLSMEEIQALLADYGKRIPFFRRAAEGIDDSRKRIQGQLPYSEE